MQVVHRIAGVVAAIAIVAIGRMSVYSAEPIGDAAVARDRALYSGTWRLVAVEANGEEKREQDRTVIVVNRLDGSWTMTIDDLETHHGESRIDPLASPPEIAIEITGGDGSGTVLRAIYEVGETRRRICFRGEQGWRPREFRTQSGDGAVLVTFEKVADATAP